MADSLAPGEQQEQDLRTGGFSDDEISDWKSKAAGDLTAGGFSNQEVKDYFGVKDPDLGPTKQFVKANLQKYNSDVSTISPENGNNIPKHQTPAKGFVEALEAGLQISTAGLGLRGKMPDTIVPDDAGWAMRAAGQIGQVVGDLPSMALGGAAGEAVAGPVGAAAGAFAAPAALRKLLIDHYTKGDIKDAGDFMQRAMGATWEAIKGGVTGAATAVAGPAAEAVAGPIAKFGTELATMTTVGKALEGSMPSAQDFVDGAVVLGGLHAATGVSAKLMDIYAKTGEHPAEIIKAAQSDVQLKQELLSTSTDRPNVPPPMEQTAEGGHIVNPMFDQEVAEAKAKSKAAELNVSPEAQEILSKIGEKPEAESKSIKEIGQDWYANNVDYTSNLKRAIEHTQEITGDKNISAEDNAHIQARLFASHADKVASFFTDGTRDAETDNINGESLNQIYKDVPENNQADFDAYAMAKRGLELDDKGITPWKDFNREGAEKVVSDGSSKYEELNQRRIDFQNRVLEYGYKKGLYDEASYNRMVKAGESYLPLHRIQEPDAFTGQAEGGSAIVKRIYGSEADVVNPRESVYKNTELILRKADINDIRNKAIENLSFEDENGKLQSDFLKEVPKKMRPVTVGSDELAQALKEQGINLKPDDISVFRPESSYLKDNQIQVRVDGKMKVYEGDPGVIDTLKKLEGDATAMDVTTKILSGFNKFLRIGTTSDIGFGFRHFFRSAIMSGVYTQTGQIPFVHPLLTLGEFMGKDSETYKNWVYDGGAIKQWNELGENYIENHLQESDSKYPFFDHAWNLIKTPFEASEAFIKLTDNLSRFTEYKRAVEQGKTRTEAAFLSREVTPDAQKMGLQRSIIRTGTAFLGAHINSLDRMSQAFTEDPKGTLAKVAVIAGMSAMVWAVNKDDKEIENLPDYQKDLYWNLNLSRMSGTGKDGTGMIIRFPKPWAPGIIFGSGIERALDAFVKGNPDAGKGFAKSVLDSVVPNIMPTMAEPILDQYANKNRFTGRLLVDDQKQKMLPEMQYTPYTSETAKQLAKLIGYVPGVRTIGPNSDPLASPAVVENYIRGWTGTIGGWALKLGDEALERAGVTPKNTGVHSADTLADAPILNEFITRFPNMKGQDITNFYEKVDETTKVLNSIRFAAKQGDFKAANRIANADPELDFKLSNMATGIATARKSIQAVQDNPGIPPVEKRQLIDTMLFQASAIARMGNKMMNDFKKSIDDNKAGGK